MKLCPQCDFIYEDDQSVCDMDGKELVSNPGQIVTRQDLATPPAPTPNPASDIAPIPVASRRWRNLAVATLVGFFLAALIIVAYLARTHQLSSRRAPEVSQPSTDRSADQIPPQSTSGDTTGQPSSPDLIATPARRADAESSSSAQPDPSTVNSSAESSDSKESLAHTRLTPGLVTAGSPSGNIRGPVILRLTNGAAIRADEAWEKREGVWYRQGGVVTFLERSQVRTIERLPANTAIARSRSANNTVEKSRRTEVAADPKKESKVTSFLKKTGRILKKPFKF